MSPFRKDRWATTPLFTSFNAQQDMMSLQSTCRKDADEICGLYLLSLILLGAGCPGKSLSQAQLFVPLECSGRGWEHIQPWCFAGWAGEDTELWNPGWHLSELLRERRRCLFHYSPKAVTNSESKPHLTSKRHGCLGLKNHMLAGAKEGKWAQPYCVLDSKLQCPHGTCPPNWNLTAPILHNCFKSLSEPGGQLFPQVNVASPPSNHLSSSGVCKRCRCSLDRIIYIYISL